MLSNIKFLEYKNIVYNNIICLNILLNNENTLKLMYRSVVRLY